MKRSCTAVPSNTRENIHSPFTRLGSVSSKWSPRNAPFANQTAEEVIFFGYSSISCIAVQSIDKFVHNPMLLLFLFSTFSPTLRTLSILSYLDFSKSRLGQVK